MKTHEDKARFSLKSLLLAPGVVVSCLLCLDLIHLHVLSRHPLTPEGTGWLVWLALLGLAGGSLLILLPLTAAASFTTRDLAATLARRLGPLRSRPALSRAAAGALAAAPMLLVFAWALFQGRGVARQQTVAAIGPAVAGCVLILLVVGAWLVREWLGRRGPVVRGIGWGALVSLLVGLFLADARLFVGLYQYIHVALSLAAVLGGIVLARALASAGSGPVHRAGKARLLAVSFVGAGLVLAPVVLLLRAAPEARADLIERTLYASRGVSYLSRIVALADEVDIEAEELTFEEIEAEYSEHPSLGSRRGRGSREQAPAPDILLFSIDAVNNNRFPGSGYHREVMPNIAKLLPRATRFTHAYTTVPETQYAVPGLIMSTARELGPAAAVRESGETIASGLRRVGYQTYWVYEAKDLFQGGGVLNNLELEGFDGRYGIEDDRPYGASKRILEILERRDQSRPIFIWTHLFAPHAPYTPPREFAIYGQSGSDRYDGELRAADAYVGRVLDSLADQGRLEQTVVVITADHGEWSGEGGRFGHGADVLQRTINIPLVFAGPNIDQGLTVDSPVSIIDIGPTLLELAGAAPSPSFEGHSLASALYGQGLRRPMVLSFTHNHGSTAAFLDELKLVFNRAKTVVRLYDVQADPEEERDLASSHPEQVQSMLSQVAAIDLERTVEQALEESGPDEASRAYRAQVVDSAAPVFERTLAARSLGLIEDSRPVLVELLSRTLEPPLPRLVRRRVAQSLARLGAGPLAGEVLALAEADRDPMAQALCVRSLAKTRSAKRAVERWSKASSVHVRRAAASVLLGGRARLDGPTGESLLHDSDPLVRTLAMQGLEFLRVANRETVIERAIADDPEPAVRLAATRQCAALRAKSRCLDTVLKRVARTDELGERLALIQASSKALEREPARFASLLSGPAPQRALAYAGLASSPDHDSLLLERLESETDDGAREALIRALGRRHIKQATTALIRQHGGDNFALGQAATEALLEIGPGSEDVDELVAVFPRAKQMQTKVNLLHVLGAIPRIADPRVYDLAEGMRATPMKDHHLIRALVETYSRLTDPRARRLRSDHVMYVNFGYQFWLYGYSLRPAQPAPGDEARLKLLWSIRWKQRQGVYNFVHIQGGPKQIPMNRRTVAGRAVHQWPRCKIMVDELTFQVPQTAKRLKITTGWARKRRLPVIYGNNDGKNRAVILDMALHD